MVTRTGPFEDIPWPQRLSALAVDSSEVHPRLHGYDIERDLARHYTLAETMLLALTGQIPTPTHGRAFELSLHFGCTCPIHEAPTHGARLARSFGAPLNSAVMAGALISSDALRLAVHEHRDLLRWLKKDRPGTIPPCAHRTHPSDRHTVAELRRALGADHEQFSVPPDVSRMAALLIIQSVCGLRSEEQFVVALTWATTISIVAESAATRAGGLLNFPVTTPQFRYEAPSS